jgi:uncharacterized membrane protein YraQ (UPF0718 family)
MLEFIGAMFKSVLLDIMQLAAGCLFIVAANLMKAKGYSIRADSRSKRMLAIFSTSIAGVALPFGAFGAIPVAAAAWIAGLELPLVVPLLVSNFLFNLSLPILHDDFVWNVCIAWIPLAFIAGVLSGAAMLRSREKACDPLRNGPYALLFEGQANRANYPKILLRYFEAAGLFIFAAAILNALFSLYVVYWLINTDLCILIAGSLAKLNVFNPFFDATQQLLGRIADFSALAALLLLMKTKNVVKLYAFIIVVMILFSISLWITW